MSTQGYDCIIVGGGVGGLAAGAYLCRGGVKTILLEKNKNVGGCAGSFFVNGYTFDVGGFPQYDQIHMLRELGVDSLVQFQSMGAPAIAIHFPATTVYAPKPLDDFVGQFRGVVSPEALEQARHALSSMLSIDMNKFLKLNQLMSSSKLKFLMSLLRSNPFELLRVAQLMTQDSTTWLRKRLQDEEMLQYLSYIYSLSLMFPCVRMPALLCVLMMTGFIGKLEGRWHQLKGGNINFSRALVRAMENHGGTVRTAAKVAKIAVRNGAATGVVLESGEEISGRYIISDVGIRETIKYLVGREHFDGQYVKRIESLKPTPSIFKVSLGLTEHPGLTAPVNFKVCSLDQAAWWQAIDQGYLPDKPPFMLLCKALKDPSVAPAGRYDIDILVPAPYRHRDGDWDVVKHAERNKVIAVVEEMIPGIRSKIDFEWLFTPKDYEALLGQDGGGWLPFEPSMEQMMRFPGMVTPIEKLLCVGASIKGGAGINAAANTGRQCAQKIIEALQTK